MWVFAFARTKEEILEVDLLERIHRKVDCVVSAGFVLGRRAFVAWLWDWIRFFP